MFMVVDFTHVFPNKKHALNLYLHCTESQMYHITGGFSVEKALYMLSITTKRKTNTQQRDRRARLLSAEKATLQSRANKKTNCGPALPSPWDKIYCCLWGFRSYLGWMSPQCVCMCVHFVWNWEKNHMLYVFVQKQWIVLFMHLWCVCIQTCHLWIY